jgi:hypothetical protein
MRFTKTQEQASKTLVIWGSRQTALTIIVKRDSRCWGCLGGNVAVASTLHVKVPGVEEGKRGRPRPHERLTMA